MHSHTDWRITHHKLHNPILLLYSEH